MEKLLEIPGNKVVYRDRGGTLYVGRGSDDPRAVDPGAPFGLLPILELSPEGRPQAFRVLPVESVLVVALQWEGSDDYWPRLAVDWMTAMGVPQTVRSALHAFAHSRQGSQRTRHAARRLLRETSGP